MLSELPDNTMRLLELNGAHAKPRVRWITRQPALSLANADFRGAIGLTADQLRLIKQRGGFITGDRIDDDNRAGGEK